MFLILRFVGILFAGIGIIALFNPEILKNYVAQLGEGKRIYLIGILRIIIGIIFISAASSCRLPLVIFALGVLIIIKGTLIFILGKRRVKALIDWWLNRSLTLVRLLSLIVLAIGALIIYSA